MKKPKPNKRVIPRAVTFRRLAKEIRKVGRASETVHDFANNLARAFDAEATALRQQR